MELHKNTSVVYTEDEPTFLRNLKNLYKRHERYIMPIVFIAGFIIDSITLTRIDLLFDNLILFSYLLLAACGIVIVNLYNSGKLVGTFLERIALWAPLLVQFAFGGLFSGYIIFYTRSASLIESWPFILILIVLIVGNEFFRRRYQHFGFQISILFVALFSFTIFYLPIVFGSLGAEIFLLSGLISLAIILLFVYGLSFMIPERVRKSRSVLIWSIGTIYVLLNILYFTNSIPPIPLSLKDSGIYHRVERVVDGNYIVQREQREWYEFYKTYDSDFHHLPNESVYFYSAVFAPTDLNTVILHRWQYFDFIQKEWITTDELPFLIIGGRDGGYRGYSIKTNITPGRWRVDVITKRKQLLGRASFAVTDVLIPPQLEMDIR